MSFEWPMVLPGLALLPALVVGYAWLHRRRRRDAVAYSSVALLRAAGAGRGGWRRHAPFALLLGALALLGLAGARPQLSADVPVAATSVIVAMDVSGSMCATDVAPNRLTAAQAAVRRFVRAQDSSTKIGIVVFSGFAQLAVPPTADHDELLRTVDSLTTGRGTTIGAAILKSVDAIAEINPDVAPAGDDPADPADPAGPAAGPPPGQYAPEIVVLLTDGANTRGIAPIEAAKVAQARGVRVYPIGFGTTNPMSMVCTAAQLGGNSFGGFGGGFRGGLGRQANFLVVDEPTLRQVASITGGSYFGASDADQLEAVLADLPKHVQVQRLQLEVSVALAGLGGILLLFAFGAAARWSSFPS
ncbi:MAG TPA: VWA domain-containing protein [Dermatophilaceae bacterium]|nr:VWA domain-containing protein [Dermatophilaceae bacterium]